MVLSAAIGTMLIATSGCSGIVGYRKVPVTFRRAALEPNLDQKTVVIGPFYQRCKRFQAAVDVKQMIQRRCERTRIFNNVLVHPGVNNLEDDDFDSQSSFDKLKTEDWRKNLADWQADYLVTGIVYYESRDRSGYDSRWVTNRYGYTYPRRVYVDRLGYDFALGLVLINLGTGEIIMEKLYSADGYAEGAADEIGIFFDLAGAKIDACMETLQGRKIRTNRYLLIR